MAGVPARYAVITPCRDEIRYARYTLESVTRQSVRPDLWIIVDDGSTDGTAELLDSWAAEHDFVRVVHRADRGARAVGPGVVDAFYAGYAQLDPTQFDYLCKLDLDLALPPTYFERLLQKMADDPRLGTCSGKPYFLGPHGDLVSEGCGDETSVGMSKFYRTTCFEQIGGFVREVMWDGIDNHRCRMLGWKAASYDEPELRFVHLRPMGSSQHGILVGRQRHGYGQYFMGTGLVYMSVSALYRMARLPWIVGGLSMWLGYVRSMCRRLPRYPDVEFRRFLRRYQWACLLLGKRRATRRFEDEGGSHWTPSRA